MISYGVWPSEDFNPEIEKWVILTPSWAKKSGMREGVAERPSFPYYAILIINKSFPSGSIMSEISYALAKLCGGD